MITILQPFVPHYRKDFFDGIKKSFNIIIYCYENNQSIHNEGFKKSNKDVRVIKSIQKGPFLIYDPLPFLKKGNQAIVLMLNFTHITTWFLLITKPLHKRKIILWGHGISVKRYLKEEKHPSILLYWMIKLSDKIWLYTKKEQDIWEERFPNKEIISLNNTLSDISEIINYQPPKNKQTLKKKYKVKQDLCFIFSARFNTEYRRPDLLVRFIEKLNSNKFGFIIIGDGKIKPDFSKFENVYDFGAVYDRDFKDDLFTIADLYFQPGWVGLSIVEALAYGKPVLTFERSDDIFQSVEYAYLKQNYNSLIFKTLDELITTIHSLSPKAIEVMSKNAKIFARDFLSMDTMIARAVRTLQ